MDMNGMEVPPLLLTVDQVAARLQLSRWSVYNLIRSRELGSVTIGRSRRITEEVLCDYIRRLSERESD